MRQTSGEVHPVAHRGAIDRAFECCSLRPVANHDGRHPDLGGNCGSGAPQGAEQRQGAFSGGETVDRHDHDMVWIAPDRTHLPCLGVDGVGEHAHWGGGIDKTLQRARGPFAHCRPRDGELGPVGGEVERVQRCVRAVEQRVHGDEGRDARSTRGDGCTEREWREQARVAVDLVVPSTEHGALRPRVRRRVARACEARPIAADGGHDVDIVACGSLVLDESRDVDLDAPEARQAEVGDMGDAHASMFGRGA